MVNKLKESGYKVITFTYFILPCRFEIKHGGSIQTLKQVPHETKISVSF